MIGMTEIVPDHEAVVRIDDVSLITPIFVVHKNTKIVGLVMAVDKPMNRWCINFGGWECRYSNKSRKITIEQARKDGYTFYVA